MIFIFCLLVVLSHSKELSLDTKLVVYSQPTELTSWLDHTGVYTQSDDKYVFPCTGNMPIPDKIRFSMNATGDLKKAITIVSGNYDAVRPSNIFNASDDTCGMTYAVHGVCHQMTNRIMYTAGTAMDQSKIYGGSLSYTLYGVYGHGWEKWLKECEKKWSNKTLNTLKENIISKSEGMMKEYLEIEFSNISNKERIIKRVDLLLKYKHLKNINLRIDRKALYQAVIDFVNNVYVKNDVKHVEDEFKRVNMRFKDILGEDGYKEVFGIDYDLEKFTLRMH